MRSLIIAASLLLAAFPAHADRKVCHVTRIAGDIMSQTGAVLDPKFDRLLIETGPIMTDLKLRDGIGLRPVDGAPDGVAFYIYWYGDEIAGKSWKDPASIAFRHAGFAVQWPTFQERGTTYRVRGLRTVVRMGEAKSDREFSLETAGYQNLSAQVFPLDKRMWSEWPHDWDHRTLFEEEWPAWSNAFQAGGKLTVEFWANGDLPFATAEFDLPPLTAFNERAAADLKDFRAKVDPVTCPPGPRDTLP